MAPQSTGRTQLLGYSQYGDAITARISRTLPSISLAQPTSAHRAAYRLDFFPTPAPHADKAQTSVLDIHLNPTSLAFLLYSQGDFDWRRQQPKNLLKPSKALEFVSIQTTQEIGSGRTSYVYRAGLVPELAPFPLVVKVVSYRYLPSVAKEAIFYEHVFPQLVLVRIRLPRFVGAYGSVDGGWYALVLEDVGSTVGEGEESSDRENMAQLTSRMKRELERIGIHHGDVAPRNFLRKMDDEKLYMIDFGDAVVEQREVLERSQKERRGPVGRGASWDLPSGQH